MYKTHICAVNFFLDSFFLELAQVTGIAAILRFPMPELEEEAVEESDED